MFLNRETGQFTGPRSADLHIYLLGPPKVEWAGHTFAIPRRQARALLYRLATHLQPVPRERLCGLFWPDTGDSAARRNMSRLLTHLRRALPAPELLLTSNDHVGLDPRHTWSDTLAFERLCAALKEGVSQQAVGLYRGSFLTGFSLPDSPEFEMWATLERESWERLYLKALAALIEEQAARGEHTAAIAHARRYLATDDLAEDIHRRLIELCAITGDRSAALRQFERCVAVLERELGVSPLPETRNVYQAILEGRLPSDIAPVSRLVWTTLPSLDVPLVGRERALRQLERVYSKVQLGRGGVVLISGEPGVGKSRLMQDFARLQSAGAGIHARPLILAGAGYPDAQTMPYQPVVEALRPALSTLVGQPSGLSSSTFVGQPSGLPAMSRLIPELRDLYPDLPAPTPAEPDQSRARLFEELCQFILGLAVGPSPVLLCLDNLHWADNATLDWLAYLGRRLCDKRVLVIGTYRSAEADAVAGLRRGLARQGILSELQLQGLDEDAVLQLLSHLAHTLRTSRIQSDAALAHRICRATGGNPFFLLETLRVLIESGEWPQDQASLQDLPLPDTIRDALEARVNRLSPQARQVLEAGAVLGQTFTFESVCLTAGRREMETMDGLDELVARQLLLEQPTAYRFRHEIVREAVYRNLSVWRRRLLHRRAGDALEKLRPDGVAALAWHFERAEEPGRAARYALQAGQAAKAVFAHVEGRAYFDRALTFLERECTYLRDQEDIVANQHLQVRALDERGWALRLLGEMEAYERDLEQVARLAELLGDRRTLAHLHWRRAYAHRWFCRYAEAQEAAQAGLRLSQAADDPLLEAVCWREVGRAARATGDYRRARVALDRALGLFVELGKIVYELHTLGNLSTLYCLLGEHEQAMNIARRALARCDEAGLPLERRLPLGDIGIAAAEAGDVDLARQYLLESLVIARQIEDRTQEILCLGHLGWLCVREERAAKALEHLQAALTLAESIASRTEQGWLLSGLSKAHHLAGDVERAIACARRALDLAQASGRTYDQKLARRILERLGQG